MRTAKIGPDLRLNPGLLRDLNSDLKASKAFQFLFFLSASWWLEALKETEEVIQENAFEQKKKKPGLNLNPG